MYRLLPRTLVVAVVVGAASVLPVAGANAASLTANAVQVPGPVPIQVCGNTVGVLAVVVNDVLSSPSRGCIVVD